MEEHKTSQLPLETASALSANALRELQQRAQTALSASREQAARLEADITRQLDEIAATLSEQTVVESQHASEAELHHAEIDRLTEELNTSRDGWLTERTAWEAQREELTEQVAQLEAQNRESQDEWRNQLIDFEGRLLEQQSFWNEQRAEAAATRAELERERDELRQKFELALQDVQRLRGRVAELEHDLARRPEANQADSTELVALRAERDALSERVEELEQSPATQIDPDVEQQLSDLQRRFELAVEDVRELKTKNTKLESQLSAAGTRSPRHVDAGEMDWESQKRRLLASLEDNGDTDDEPAKTQERVTIEATIEITDAVVAEKDRQIAELTSQLGAIRDNPVADDEARGRRINDLIDTDEVIADHRKRCQQLERETEDKLRSAELEVSVERAKIARQKAELEEMRANLESERQLYESTGVVPAPGAPRRRWLSKFGINADE